MSADADAARAYIARAAERKGWTDGWTDTTIPTADQAIALAGVHAQLALVEVFERIEAAEAAAAAEYAERMAALAREKEQAAQLDDGAARDYLISIAAALGVTYGSPGWLADALDAARSRPS